MTMLGAPTAQEICNVALEIFKSAPRLGRARLQNRDGQRRRQLHVDFRILKDDFKNSDGRVSLLAYTERLIRPAIIMLAARVPEDVIFLDLELPRGIEMAAKSGCLRFTADSHLAPIAFDEETGEGTEFEFVTTGRFDVLFELA